MVAFLTTIRAQGPTGDRNGLPTTRTRVYRARRVTAYERRRMPTCP